MAMLKVVSLDVGGTLIDFSYAQYVWNEAIPRLYATKKGISFEEAKDYVLTEYDRVGSKDIRWYMPEYWFEHFKLKDDPMEVFKLHSDKVRFYPEVPSVLKDLSRKYQLIIVSGYPKDTIEIVIEKVRHYFKQVFSSVSDRREVKKTPQLYAMICKSLGIEPQALVHVGDEWYSDFIAPRKSGIKSFLLDRTGGKSGRFVISDLTELENRLTYL
jgi:HAD superfamily hydrolase (TIGR01549 family)